MAFDPLSSEPTSCAAGETVQWRRSVSEVSAGDGWSLKYYFAGPDTFQVTAEVDGDGWLATLAASDTDEAPAGAYRWTAFMEKGTGASLERYQVATGILTLTANLATATGADLQSWNEQMLAAIRATLKGVAVANVERFTIGGRSVDQITFPELLKAEREFASRVARDRNGGRLPSLEVVFGRA